MVHHTPKIYFFRVFPPFFVTSTSTVGYCTTAQALADYAAIITDLKQREVVPVVAFGGSYGGVRFCTGEKVGAIFDVSNGCPIKMDDLRVPLFLETPFWRTTKP